MKGKSNFVPTFKNYGRQRNMWTCGQADEQEGISEISYDLKPSESQGRGAARPVGEWEADARLGSRCSDRRWTHHGGLSVFIIRSVDFWAVHEPSTVVSKGHRKPPNSSENEINFELREGFIVNPSQSSHSFLNVFSNEKCGNSSLQKDWFQLAAPFSWLSNSTHIQVFLMGSCSTLSHSSRSKASRSSAVVRPFLLMF